MTDKEETPAAVDPAAKFKMPDDSPGFALAERACWHLLENIGEDVLILDLRGRSDVCDFFVLASGNSDTQVRAMAKHVQGGLFAAGHKPKGVEGTTEGRWVLLDYFDVVIHVFKTDTRQYFQLDHLWGDAGRLDVDPAWFNAAEVAARHTDLNFSTIVDPGATD